MKARVAKAILNNILWSGVLTGVSCFLLIGLYAEAFPWIAFIAFTSGLITFAFYGKVSTKIGGTTEPIFAATLSVIAGSILLALYGGIGVSILGTWVWECIEYGCGSLPSFVVVGTVPTSLIAGLITFTAYELSKRVKFDRKKQAKSPRLVHP